MPQTREQVVGNPDVVEVVPVRISLGRRSGAFVPSLLLAVGACTGESAVLVQDVAGATSDVTAIVGRELDITLGTVGPGAYDSIPTISSTAVRFLEATVVRPLVPAGPRQRFRFMPERRGTAVMTFQHSGVGPTVTITVTVR